MSDESKTTNFIITCAHEALHYEQKKLWSCSGASVAIFNDKNLAHNAIRNTIRKTQRKIKNGEIDDDNKFAKRQCYAFHSLEKAK